MIAVLVLPSLTRIGILIDFKINQDFIAEILCINKDKPMMMCNGTCYLSEQLKKAEEQEEKRVPNSQKERLEFVYYHSKNPIDFFNSQYISLGEPTASFKNELYTSSFIADIFHPPKRCSI